MDAVTFHSQQARSWEAQYQSPVFSQRIAVLSQLIGTPHGHWLDAGCGTGTIARWLASHGCSVTAVDASEEMIRSARSSPNIIFQVADVRDLPIQKASLTGIVCSSVLEYLANPADALREFSRILKPGGSLAVSVPIRNMPVNLALRTIRKATLNRWYGYLTHSKHSYTPAGFAALLKESGFTPVRHIEFGNVELPLGIRVPAKTLMMFHCVC